MNIKTTFAILALIPAAASAQVMLPAGRISLPISAPISLPSPATPIAIVPRLGLPALTPVIPAPILAPAPVAIPTLPSVLQARRFAAAAAEPVPAKDVEAARRGAEKLFDGREADNIRSDRHHSVPEADLEKEIGAF